MRPTVRFLCAWCAAIWLLTACDRTGEPAAREAAVAVVEPTPITTVPAAVQEVEVGPSKSLMESCASESSDVAEVMEPEEINAVPLDPMAVFEAVSANDEAKLEELLQAGLPAEQRNEEGDTPLCLSLRRRFLSLAVKLIEHGADPNTPGLWQQVPVVLASMYRHPTLLEDLLKAGADPNVPFSHPAAPELLEVVPDPWLRGELKRERNVTALMACSLRGDVEGVIALVKNGARKNAHTLPGYRYPINMAAGRGYLFIMRVLLGRDPDEEPARLITVDLTHQKFWVVQHGEEILRSSISSGRNGKETPPGRYVITNKHKEWVSTIYKVPMPYFLRFNCSEIGFHSGRVTGRPASAGCVRLPHATAKKLFDLAQVGDEVIIEP
jgi:hypothetical protein